MIGAQRRFIIRTDASAEIGLGHIMRCFGIAQALMKRGCDVFLAGSSTTHGILQNLSGNDSGLDSIIIEKQHPHHDDLSHMLRMLNSEFKSNPGMCTWVIVDGYHFTETYLEAIRNTGCRVMVIDDMAHLTHYHADVILNPNLHATELTYARDPDTVLLMGGRYSIVRNAFLLFAGYPRPNRAKARRILITMGGTDTHNVTIKILEAVDSLNDTELIVKVVVGSINPNKALLTERVSDVDFNCQLIENVSDMAKLMEWSDLAISAGGTTCLELAFMGVPFITVATASNQIAITEYLNRAGMTLNLGWYDSLAIPEIASAIRELIDNDSKRRQLSKRGRRSVDGKGAERIADALIPMKFGLRDANHHDCNIIWQWANDPTVREASFNPDPIPFEDHENWFHHRMQDEMCRIYIAETADQVPFGQARIEFDGTKAVISVSIDPLFRAKGLGARLIRTASEMALDTLPIDFIEALIKPENERSFQAFKRAGYKETSRLTMHGKPCRQLSYSREVRL